MRRRTDRTPEKVGQQHIAQLLRGLGGAVFTVGTRRPRGEYQGTCQTPGLPDLFAFVRDTRQPRWLFVAIEVKAEGGRLTDEQRAFREHCQRADVHHIVGDLDAVFAWLLERGILTREQIPHYRLPAIDGRQSA